MKIWKKITAFALTASMLVSMALPSQAAGSGRFSDAAKKVAESSDLKSGPVIDETTRARAAAYLDVLHKYKERILLYDWQNLFYKAGLDISVSATEDSLRPVVLADVFGDSAPELIFGAARLHEYEGNWMAGSAEILIYTFNGTEAVQILSRDSDYVAGGGGRYALLQCAGTKNLFFYESSGDENWTVSWTVYSATGDKMTAGNIIKVDSYPDYESETLVENASKNGSFISMEEYEKARSQIIQSADTLLLFNYADDEDLAAKAQTLKSHSISYREMEAELLRECGQDPDDYALMLQELPDNFEFLSGAGGWSTELTLNDDGTFQGVYHDSDADQMYLCSFRGSFTDFKHIDNNCWSMRLSSLEYDQTPGYEWTDPSGIHCIASEAYGLEGGNTFYIYLLGYPTDELPEGYMSWARMYMSSYNSSYSDPVVSNIYGLYNVDREYGFGSPAYDVYQAAAAATSDQVNTLDNITVDSSLTQNKVQQPAVSGGQGQPAQGYQGLRQLLPQSSSILMTGADIAGMTSDELQTAINEIYARHGYKFKTPEILAYFMQYNWYAPSIEDQTVVYNSFSDIEKQNVELLSSSMH